MYCFRTTVTTDKGDALVGWQLECVQNDNLTTPVTIYADESLTPIASVSGISNKAVTDSAGNVYFFVQNGLYGIRYYDSEGVYQKTDRYISMLGNVVRSIDEFTTHAAADAAGIELYVPSNITSSRATGAAVVANQWGPGRVTTADGNKRGKWFSAVSAAPSSLGNHDSIETAFNGDLSHSIFQIEHRITGATTLTQPTTGYVYTPEAYPFYGVLYTSSGYNHSTTGNTGRTAACFSRVSVKHYGQGDAVCYNASAFVNSTKVGATSFLAQPAAVLFNGDVTAGADYVYLNPREVYLDGVTYDVAAIGDVINMERNVATGAQDCWWGGVRIQSIGSVAINCLMSATGKVNAGIDLSMSALDFGANKAAVSLKTGDRVYFNNSSSNGNYTTTFNGDYIEHSSGVGGLNFVVGGTSIFQITTDRLTMNKPPRLPTVTVAGLPAASTRSGMEYYVSDASATTRFSTVAGGGANFVKVFSDGTNWVIA